MNLSNKLYVGKENLTPSHMNILSPQTIPSSRTSATQQPFSKSISSSSLSKPTIGTYSRSKALIQIPSFEELKSNQQPFHTLSELFSKLDTFPNLHNDQKIEFIKLCITCIDKSFLKVHERDIYMFWIILAIQFVGNKDIPNWDEEVRKRLAEHFEFLSNYNHPVKDEENFYILNALFEWKTNEQPDKIFRSISKVQQGINRLGETPILAEIKGSLLQKSIFPQVEISYKPTTMIPSFQNLQVPSSTPTTKSTSPQDVSNSGAGLFTGNRRRRSNSNNDFQLIQQNSTRQSSRSNLFAGSKQSSININAEMPSISSSPFISSTSLSSNSVSATPTTALSIKTTSVPPTQSTPQPLPTLTFPTPTSINTENVNKRPREEVVSTPSATPNTSTAPNSTSTSAVSEDGSAKRSKPTVFVPINNREYQVLKRIGSGGSCTVYKCVDTNTKEEVAIKHIKIDRTKNDKTVLDGFLAEATLLEQLRADDIGENIIKLIDYEYRPHNKRDEILLVMELGTTDFNNIIKKKSANQSFTTDELRVYWRQMLEAVSFIHSKKIVHTDIKPANFLLVNGKLKLIDFGIAKVPDHEQTLSICRNSIVGTLNFMPPESFINHNANDPKYKFGPPGDIWSLGIIFYQTIYQKTPFSDFEDHLTKIAQITDRNKEPYFPPCEEQYQEAVDLLKTILVKDPSQRPSIRTILEHPFFAQPLQLSINTNEEQEAFCKNVLKTFEFLLENLPSQSVPPQKAAFRLLKLCHDNKNGEEMSEDDITNCLSQ
ncbi:predicted protein [Naegleria gruberi]|uniref:Predicted protein n=1 Tax=Naegleria gruberi TaxID=5762 RepID=D2VKL3_NAEGR|nr:uncharacterized protein NAEGRDRAFT_69434 [Naegleria gruberi]EFC42615.1 predicted protein [Naegleria gruberi]|eukprot:XP_002675359.1 predicted protein [Naegleria gruberi strain NEG-M]